MNINLFVVSILIEFIVFETVRVESTDEICYRSSYGRGAGVPLSSCGDGYERDGALCYPTCETDYTGAGPVCWEDCREGYDNHGATCFINAHIYGKGCCCGAFSPDCCKVCPDGYVDDGCTCRKNVEVYFKKSYGRGPGIAMSCKSDEENNGGLCYNPCGNGYSGKGPICWSNCDETFSYSCGEVFCAVSTTACTAELAKLTAAGLGIATAAGIATIGKDISLLLSGVGVVGSIFGLTSGLVVPRCNITTS